MGLLSSFSKKSKKTEKLAEKVAVKVTAPVKEVKALKVEDTKKQNGANSANDEAKADPETKKASEIVTEVRSESQSEATAPKEKGRIDELIAEIKPLQQQLVDHTVYGAVESVEDLKRFMQSHIFAVWDFMSLLKYLQAKLTCISVPWVPVGTPETRYLINEIVTDEECDVDENGERMSHFELYLRAMARAGASTEVVEKFIDLVAKDKVEPRQALSQVEVPEHVREFVGSTFAFIDQDKPHVAAAVFTFGREDLIPGMFISFVRNLYKEEPEKYSIFKYYLERHIEVDGDHHAILAHQMTAVLCGDDETKWVEATEAVKSALQARIQLWNGIEKLLHDAKA